MQDIIFINQLPTQAIIGIHDYEKVTPQKLIISVEMGCDSRQAAATDDIQYALNYDGISRFIDNAVQTSQCQLLEALAEQLVTQLFDHFPMQSIRLTVQKPGAISYTQQVGLTIYRERS